MLNIQPPDLTGISARNGGSFPFLEMVQIIDGRGEALHPGIMPVWGDRLGAEFGELYGPYGGELMIRGRIMSLVRFLETIQQ